VDSIEESETSTHKPGTEGKRFVHQVLVSDTKSVQEHDLWGQFSDTIAVTTNVARTTEEVIDAGRGMDAIVVDANTPVTAEVIEALELRVIGRAGTGVDNIDREAASAAGVTVVNVPEYCIDEVSTNAVSLFLACARNVHRYDRSTERGEWDWEAGKPIHRLNGQTLGLLAFGDIARRTARKLDGFGLELLAHDPYVPDSAFDDSGVQPVSFDELVEHADHLSIHAPLTPDTRNLVDAAVLEQLPEHAVVVNHGRGGIVDESALLAALDDGSIAGAGLDVLAEEPPTDPAIVEHERTIVTPHSAWYSEESLRDVIETVAGDVIRVLDADEPAHPVDTGWA
jgi:D-3-phosphoglycerate dehydrogenase